jgi:hypothetical protein
LRFSAFLAAHIQWNYRVISQADRRVSYHLKLLKRY